MQFTREKEKLDINFSLTSNKIFSKCTMENQSSGAQFIRFDTFLRYISYIYEWKNQETFRVSHVRELKALGA